MQRWSKAETKALLDGLGAYGLDWFVRRTKSGNKWAVTPHRSVAAVYAKILQEYGPGGLTRGAYTLNAVIEYSGYSRTQILRAQKALKQKWRRTSARGSYLISDEQLEDILEWLKHDYWCSQKRLYACVWCTGEAKRHYALGLCNACYFRYRRFCDDLDVPHCCKKMRKLVAALRKALPAEGPHATLLENLEKMLKRGIAPPPAYLEWLYLAK